MYHQLSKGGKMLTAKDIMSTETITVLPSMAVDELARLLCERKIGGAPVVDEANNLLGVVTESDLIDQAKNVHLPTVISILDSFIFLESPEKLDKEIRKMAGRTVKDILTKDPITVSTDTPLNEIATIMSEKKVHTLPVLDQNGAIVGIVGKLDLIKTIS